jgi:hypothetical protein
MKLLAKALYDNEAESDEELDFKKNDILEIIDKNQDGLEGWWLCKLNNKTGLAPGNRLKIIDERTEKSISLNRTILPIKRIESITQSVSAKNSQFITSSVENILKNYQSTSSTTSNTTKSLSVDISSSHDDEDEDDYDYEYDIPLNNNELTQMQKRAQIQQLITNKPLTKIAHEITNNTNNNNNNHEINLKTRKSNSPTIDSGISSSLMSLNESTQSTHEQHHTNESIPNEAYLRSILKNIRDTTNTLINIQKIHKDWRKRSHLENSIQIIKCNCNELKKHLHDLFDYIKNNYKSKLNDKLKDYQLQLHKFINFYDSNLLILNSINWNIELLESKENINKSLSVNDELNEILIRLNYLNDLIRLIYDCLIQQLNINHLKSEVNKVNLDSSDDNDVYENDDYEWLSNSTSISQKKLIKNESLYTEDRLLIKFYFKIIEDNLNEMLDSHKKLKIIQQQQNDDDLSHKLALNGHKLVFICDTLNRNIKNKSLKYELEETSNNLCDNLKLYVIRMKNQQQQQLINESLIQICNNANKLKQLLVKFL